MKIAFAHPIDPTIIVFIQGDMPHLIKKIVNALESSSNPSSRRDISLGGYPVSLGRLREIWAKQREMTKGHLRTEK